MQACDSSSLRRWAHQASSTMRAAARPRPALLLLLLLQACAPSAFAAPSVGAASASAAAAAGDDVAAGAMSWPGSRSLLQVRFHPIRGNIPSHEESVRFVMLLSFLLW